MCNSLYDGNLMSRPSASQRFLSVGSYFVSYCRCTVLCTARLTVTHIIAMYDALTVGYSTRLPPNGYVTTVL